MKFDVTRERINRGQRHCGWACPVAIAVQDDLGLEGDDVFVANDWIEIEDDRYPLPPEAANWIARYDESGDADPISFEIDMDSLYYADEDDEFAGDGEGGK